MLIDIVEISDLFKALFGVWAFLFSPSYRRKTLKRWKIESRLTIFFELVFSLVGFAFSIYIIYYLLDMVLD